MGIPVAQAAQPISQQQGPQGKGGYGNAPVGPAANMQQVDDTMQQIMPANLDQNAINADPQGFARWQQGANQQEQQHPGSTMNAAAGGFNQQPFQGKGSMPQNMQMPQQQPQQQFGKGGTTNSATSGQPRMGISNPYPNTIQPWDNASIQPQTQSGKGKGH